jgi:hypothetical protein
LGVTGCGFRITLIAFFADFSPWQNQRERTGSR